MNDSVAFAPQRFRSDDTGGIAACFERCGFAIVAGAIDLSDMLRLGGDIVRLIEAALVRVGAEKFGDMLDQGILDLERIDHDLVAAIYDTVPQLPSFQNICGNRRLEQLARVLLDAPSHPLYGFTQRCRIDPPGDDRRTYGWHQEIFYTIPSSRFVQTWAPLIRPTTLENGTIEVAAGSHKRHGLPWCPPQTWADAPGRAAQILIDDKALADCPRISVAMQPGEVMFFDGHLAHRSGRNVSRQVRYSLVGMYHDAAAPGFNAPRPRFEYRGPTPRDYFEHWAWIWRRGAEDE